MSPWVVELFFVLLVFVIAGIGVVSIAINRRRRLGQALAISMRSKKLPGTDGRPQGALRRQDLLGQVLRRIGPWGGEPCPSSC